MAEVQLAAEARHDTGSPAARRLRHQGKVPAVLYGHGIEPQPLAVGERDLRGALNGVAGLNALLTLQVDSTRHLAMARQLQRDPLKGHVTHVDFVIVRRDEIVSVEVPIRLVGEATEVNKADGLIEQTLFTMTVHAKPGDLPPHIDIDISGLSVGDAVRIGDVKLPSGVSTDLDPEEAVVIASASTVAAQAEEPGEDGAEAAAEGGGEAGSSEG